MKCTISAPPRLLARWEDEERWRDVDKTEENFGGLMSAKSLVDDLTGRHNRRGSFNLVEQQRKGIDGQTTT